MIFYEIEYCEKINLFVFLGQGHNKECCKECIAEFDDIKYRSQAWMHPEKAIYTTNGYDWIEYDSSK